MASGFARVVVFNLTLAACGVVVSAQTSKDSRPSFRTGVDVTILDVTVVDSTGNPVRDLGIGDFAVRVDGKKRRIVSAELVEHGMPGVKPARTGLPAETDNVSTNEDVEPGRTIMLVFDTISFHPGEERRAVPLIRSFLDTLSPTDRVAAGNLPWTDASIGFTTDRDRVKQWVLRQFGTKGDDSTPSRLGIAESLRTTRGDTMAWRQILARVCNASMFSVSAPGGVDAPAQCNAPGYEPDCPCQTQDRIKGEVHMLVSTVRYDAQRQVVALLDLLQALQQVPGPKTVFLLSQGALVDDLPIARGALAAAAGLADARVYVLGVEVSPYDASSGDRAKDRFDDQKLYFDGLGDLAGMLGGRVYRLIGDPGVQIERVWRENAATWRVAIETLPEDVDRRPHAVDTKVSRPHVTVRARSHFIAASAPPPGARRLTLRDAVLSPVPVATLPFRLTHYASARPAQGDRLVQLVGEFAAPAGTAAKPEVLFVCFDAQGKQAAAGTGEFTNHALDGDGWLHFRSEIVLPPGSYIVKAAAIAPDGTVGSVERRVELPALPTTRVALGDLFLGEAGTGDAAIVPVVAPTVGNGRLLAYVELYAPEGDAPSAAMSFEIARAPDQAPIARLPVALQPADRPRTQVASASLSVGRLADGDYVARAVATSGGERVEGRWRRFHVGKAATR